MKLDHHQQLINPHSGIPNEIAPNLFLMLGTSEYTIYQPMRTQFLRISICISQFSYC